MYVNFKSPIIDKLTILARGDIGLVSNAIRATAKWEPARWWRKGKWVADLKAVVDYIVAKSQCDR